MAETKFIWVLADQAPISGPALKQGQVYSTSDFPAGVAEEWVRTGAAKLSEPTMTNGSTKKSKP